MNNPIMKIRKPSRVRCFAAKLCRTMVLQKVGVMTGSQLPH